MNRGPKNILGNDRSGGSPGRRDARFVGLIPGGIMNGIAGNPQDEPILDQAYDLDWRTCEYWSPHVAFYLWAVSELERAAAT